jgi:hypothetical protein
MEHPRQSLPSLAARALGWGLVALALIAAAIEAGVLMAREDWGSLSALGLWDYVAPYSLRGFRAGVRESLGAGAWDYGMALLLTLPGWLILGAPGVLLVWLNRSRIPPTPEELLIRAALDRPEPDDADTNLDADELRAFMDSIPDDPEKKNK